ncbi:MAG: PAS domain-containing protein [Parvibaculaceae bacterium]
MSIEGTEENRSAWILPVMSWSAINKAKARLRGSIEDVSSHIDDIELRPISRELFAWWREARDERAMPAAEDVDPKALVELLPYFRMLRWEDEERLEFRIYGSALTEATGMDLTGMNSIAPFDYDGKADDVARLKLMHKHPCGLLLHRDLSRPDGSTYTCEFMNLPVSGGAENGNRIIGTITPCAQFDERKLDFSLKTALTVRRAVFIDIGFGLPDEAKALSV